MDDFGVVNVVIKAVNNDYVHCLLIFWLIFVIELMNFDCEVWKNSSQSLG